MALFTESTVRKRARQESTNFSKASSDLLVERVQKQASVAGFDIFLSHAFDDKELLEGSLLLLEDLGYSVYLDWKNDPQLDRTKVTTATADTLRKRMHSCRCLFFAVTPEAKDSVWMRWELGWKDGDNSRVAVLPIEGRTTEAWKWAAVPRALPLRIRRNNSEFSERSTLDSPQRVLLCELRSLAGRQRTIRTLEIKCHTRRTQNRPSPDPRIRRGHRLDDCVPRGSRAAARV